MIRALLAGSYLGLVSRVLFLLLFRFLRVALGRSSVMYYERWVLLTICVDVGIESVCVCVFVVKC